MDENKGIELTFEYLWKCYKGNLSWQMFGGFANWWKIPFLERGSWKFVNFNEGYFPYDHSFNRYYPAATAFCRQYVANLMERVFDYENFGLQIPEGQEPPEDEKEPCDIGLVCEFFKVQELKDYLKDEFNLFLEAMTRDGAGYVCNEQKTIIGFYAKAEEEN